MELEELKTAWSKQKTVGYSPEELNSIFYLKQAHRFAAIRSTFSRDLQVAVILSLLFIVALQILDFRTSNFWSACMAIFAIQLVWFYQLQLYLLRRYSVFNRDINLSLTRAIKKIRSLLWFYRLWPATLTIILSVVYVSLFEPELPNLLLIAGGIFLAAVVAFLSNIISAVLIRSHLIKLENLRQDWLKLSAKKL